VNRSPNRVLLLVLAALAVVAVVAGIVSATRNTQQYDRSTPEGVVQAYLTALVDRDQEEAAELLADDSPCTVEDLDQAAIGDDVRVILRDTETEGDSASVDVEVVMNSGAVFGAAEWTERHTFRLVSEGDAWRITGTPWPMFECGGEG
jgi:hypothetical protein